MTIAVAHLVRAANDISHFERFLAACDAQASVGEVPHELCLAFKGFDEGTIAPYLDRLAGRPHRALRFADEGFDLGVYFLLAEQTEYDTYLFCNSFTEPTAPQWVRKLTAPLADPMVAVTGSSGSWERIYPDQPWPNLHIRTTGFAVRREVFLSLSRPAFTEKRQANAFEAGPDSMTRQLLARSLEPLVIDRDGKAWKPDAWRESRTFRPGDQALMADHRMTKYAAADADTRAWLEAMAWTRDPDTRPPRRRLGYRLKKLLGG